MSQLWHTDVARLGYSRGVTTEPRMMLIDGHSMAFRAFYALPAENFATATGQHTNAVHGFVSMLLNVLRDENPTHLLVAFDVDRKTFRTDEYADYKGTRAATPPEFSGQVELIRQVLDAMNIAHASVDNYEADDIIATMSARSAERHWPTVIITGDRDSFQLVDDSTTVLYPVKGVSELARMTPEAIEAKYGVGPQRYPEMAALVGETSDNLPGVPGVGPKTAAKWLTAHDGLDNLLAVADTIKGKAGESLRVHIDDVRRNRRLNRLVRDLELPVTIDDTAVGGFDREAIHQLFDALEFRTLRERLFSMYGEATEQMADLTVEIVADVLVEGELGTWLKAHATGTIGMIPRGRWGQGIGELTGIALASSDSHACWVPVADLGPEDEQALAAWLADSDRPKVMHGAKPPMLAIKAHGWRLAGLTCDTELAAYLLRPDQRSYDLEDLAIRYLKMEISATGDDDQQVLDLVDDTSRKLDLFRARALVDLAEVLGKQLTEVGQAQLLTEVEMPLQVELAEMEIRGVGVDADLLDALNHEFDGKVMEAQQAAWQSVGREVNLGSPKQLQSVLFDQLDLPRTKKIKSGYTTDAEALENLFATTGHPFLAYLLAYRDAIKLRQAVEGLQRSVCDDGRIHTTYLQTIAATGRLSSADPNLQNIPIRTEQGRRIREAFVVGDDYEALMSADYSQIEMRVMAHASGDADLVEAFRSGVDFHTVTASKVFGVPADQVSGEQRASVKQMNYGLAYGLSAYGLSSRLGVPVSQARELMEDYFATFGGVRDYLDEIVARARQDGWTQTLLGRRRYLPDLNSSNRQRREMAERAALNAPIQGSAADIIKIAMLRLSNALSEAKLSSRILLQIHDELVLEVAPGEKQEVTDLVLTHMTGAVELAVPLDVSIGYGPNWLAAGH